VSVLIPDAVLTGQRYDVDVVFDDPLDGAVAAGGLAAITPEQISALESPDLELAALGGGGLFKSVQAPLQPGSQTWAVLLVHPKGIVSTTKRVRVVADKAALTP
jgi:threonine dehydratase